LRMSIRVLLGLYSMQQPPTQKVLIHAQLMIQLFTGIVDGVKKMHQQGHAHRDIKLENVLLDHHNTPVLMDFGSVGPLKVPIQSKAALMAEFDDAATNCTMSYRAPELFEGGARYGEVDIDGRVDVWSLGCVLFGMMYGASPFECEFRGESVKIVECSYLRVLGKVPTPPNGTKLASRYHPDLLAAVNWMLNQDRTERPTIDKVASRVEHLLQQFHGSRSWPTDQRKVAAMDIDLSGADGDEFDSFLRERESLV
jgi:serine/threonine kinase 16